MPPDEKSPYSAAPQGIGYIYQPRFALLKILDFSESSSVLIEKEDDLDFIDAGGKKSLASLKHKAPGDRVNDLSTDFWKSVRVWLASYNRADRTASNLRFFLFTTAVVSEASFLVNFLEGSERSESLAILAREIMATSKSELVSEVRVSFRDLSDDEAEDFMSRIIIIDNSPRITDLPHMIQERHLRTIRRENRPHVFERLEGWWNDLMVKMLTGDRTDPVFGYEVSDKLSAIAEEYRSDNLPITFRNATPDAIDAENDPRLFVEQLRSIGISTNRIQSAIVDYYRAFEQRSAWARESLLVSGEIEDYEDRLADEWSRYKDVVFESLNDASGEEALSTAGRNLYRWAEFETERFRIRERVTEPYVVRGAFHMLANIRPSPRIFWHPRFLDRLAAVLEVNA
jgi:hypothetical protein